MNDSLPVLRDARVRRRGSRKLLMLLIFLFMILLAILFFRSPISKIDQIQIAGNQLAKTEQLMQAVGIREGDSFFSAGSRALESRLEQLGPVKDAVVEKRFPGLVSIRITEYATVAYEIDAQSNRIVAILANGTTAEVNQSIVLDKPFLTGWENKGDLKARLCRVLAEIPAYFLADISEIKPFPSEAYPDKIKMYTRSHFEVITTISYLAEKLTYLNAIVDTQEPGIITMLEADTYTPFHPPEPEDEAKSALENKKTTQ
jgi:cell division protein FtsQ